jgi:hypothetical protein
LVRSNVTTATSSRDFLQSAAISEAIPCDCPLNLNREMMISEKTEVFQLSIESEQRERVLARPDSDSRLAKCRAALTIIQIGAQRGNSGCHELRNFCVTANSRQSDAIELQCNATESEWIGEKLKYDDAPHRADTLNTELNFSICSD